MSGEQLEAKCPACGVRAVELNDDGDAGVCHNCCAFVALIPADETPYDDTDDRILNRRYT